MTQTSKDRFDALRSIIDALTPFEPKERGEILGLAQMAIGVTPAPPAGPLAAPTQTTKESKPATQKKRSIDIRTFVQGKKPSSDQQFAATVAYYYEFEAAEEEQKKEITGSDLKEACRLAKWLIPPAPVQTLRNAQQHGLMEKGEVSGAYKLSTVGENLVAMALPSTEESRAKTPRKRKRNTPSRKKAAKKKIPRKRKSGK